MAQPNYALLADQIAQRTAQQYGIDPNYFKAIFHAQINQESGFNPNARSGAGAEGIAQIVPRYHPGVNPFNPQQALAYAARMDANNFKRYGNARDALAVYNSGRPWAVSHRFGETNNYVRSILSAAGHPQPSAPTTPTRGQPLGYAAQPTGNVNSQRLALIQSVLKWASGGSQTPSQGVPAPGQGVFNPMAVRSPEDPPEWTGAGGIHVGGELGPGGIIWAPGEAPPGEPESPEPLPSPKNFKVGGKIVGVPDSLATHSGIGLAAPILGQAEALAKRFGVKINSGYRSPQHNASVGGARNSDHLSGDAVDYVGSPAAMRALYNYALKAGYAYVEPWAQAGGNHVHISFARGIKA